MNGHVVFWDLSHVPKDYREGRREDTFRFRSPRPVGAGTCQIRIPNPQRYQSLMGSGGAVLKAELPLLGGAPL
ncbi:unnamed protein product [Staurois parvus]|uniref:Uncharacterized protein n=1 Tax=Staurois parvus TaxID=386267 RepID=A0ABN9FRJ8_9NEOB|nr:unnamed protein product [Staurois parvus]